MIQRLMFCLFHRQGDGSYSSFSEVPDGLVSLQRGTTAQVCLSSLSQIDLRGARALEWLGRAAAPPTGHMNPSASLGTATGLRGSS